MTGVSTSRRGYTLIEMLLIMAIIIVIAAVAIASLLRSRISANETSAISTLKQIVTAEEQYKSNSGTSVYVNLSSLSATVPPFLVPDVGSGKKSGYCFLLTLLPNPTIRASYKVNGNPTSFGKTGNRYFYVDQRGVVRFNDTQPAESIDDPVDAGG